MTDLAGYTPIAAAAFGVPQFVPQIVKLRASDDTAGLSWSWAALTALNNAAWFCYFLLAHYWTALVASSSVTLLAGTLTVMLTRRGPMSWRPLAVIGCWAAVLAGGYGVAGRDGLGTLLAAAFAVQVAPSLWSAYRTAHPTGISAGTWALILGELACFTVYGLHESDPRVTALGTTGVVASVLMLARLYRTSRRSDSPGQASRRDRTSPAASSVPAGQPTSTSIDAAGENSPACGCSATTCEAAKPIVNLPMSSFHGAGRNRHKPATR
jgi:hypothetical protein